MHQKIKLKSRRNDVFRVWENEKVTIHKQFGRAEDCLNEVTFLELLKAQGLEVPLVLEESDHHLILEDLGDVTLLDWYETMEQANDTDYQEVLLQLAQWLKRFYQIVETHMGKAFVLSDVNFKNFILKNGVVYGIDFEETAPGNILSDCGQLGAFALTYKPMNTPWKQAFVDRLFETLVEILALDETALRTEYEQALKVLIQRRGS